jgi:DNA-binding XRE family transcriptional regulator
VFVVSTLTVLVLLARAAEVSPAASSPPVIDPRKLRSARLRKNLRREDSAAATGLSYRSVCSHEQGASTPSTAALLGYAAVYGVAVEDLLSDAEEVGR